MFIYLITIFHGVIRPTQSFDHHIFFSKMEAHGNLTTPKKFWVDCKKKMKKINSVKIKKMKKSVKKFWKEYEKWKKFIMDVKI